MKNPKTKIILRDISLTILEVIVNFPFVVGHAFLTPNKLCEQIELKGFRITRFSERIKYLEKSGYIKINNNSIVLTDKGNIKCLENSKDKSSDGRWRILSFDIPEEFRKRRDRFRRSIKQIGFRQVQKSLWACPYNKADDEILVIKMHEVEKFVAYFVVEKTDIENELKKIFKTQ